jgi:hypothetical protein
VYHRWPDSNAEGGSKNNMVSYAMYMIGCLIVITLLMVYWPVLFIRKTDKLLKILQQIEANTRKP